jgi:hypothetical protein
MIYTHWNGTPCIVEFIKRTFISQYYTRTPFSIWGVRTFVQHQGRYSILLLPGSPARALLFLHNMEQHDGSWSALLICNQIILEKKMSIYMNWAWVPIPEKKIIIYHLSMILTIRKVIPLWFTVNKETFITFPEPLQRILYSWTIWRPSVPY